MFKKILIGSMVAVLLTQSAAFATTQQDEANEAFQHQLEAERSTLEQKVNSSLSDEEKQRYQNIVSLQALELQLADAKNTSRNVKIGGVSLILMAIGTGIIYKFLPISGELAYITNAAQIVQPGIKVYALRNASGQFLWNTFETGFGAPIQRALKIGGLLSGVSSSGAGVVLVALTVEQITSLAQKVQAAKAELGLK